MKDKPIGYALEDSKPTLNERGEVIGATVRIAFGGPWPFPKREPVIEGEFKVVSDHPEPRVTSYIHRRPE